MMPSIELSKLQGIGQTRALAESERSQLGSRPTQPGSQANGASNAPGVAVEVSAADLAANPPVDENRVTEIRNALRDGNYPLLPTKIADAMIAARLGFGQY